MKQDVKHYEVFARPETVGEAFGLILDAFAEAFRGMHSASRLESRWSKLRHCGESF